MNGLQQIPCEDYLKIPALSKSGLDRLYRSPAHFNTPNPETKAMTIGAAFHAMTLEPEKWERKFVVAAEGQEFRSKADREWKALQEMESRSVLTYKDGAMLQEMARSVLAHPAAKGLLSRADMTEVSAIWTADGVERKARFDAVLSREKIILEAKTTVTAHPDEFDREVFNRRYHWQAAWYLDAIEAVTGETGWSFVWIAVEKTPPYPVACYCPDAEMLDLARQQYAPLVELYRECTESGIWPAYPEKVQALRLPAWARKEK